MALNRVQTVTAFFSDRKVTMDEMKECKKAGVFQEIADLCRDEMIRRGTHTAEDFHFEEVKP